MIFQKPSLRTDLFVVPFSETLHVIALHAKTARATRHLNKAIQHMQSILRQAG